jgi:spermidine synthase
MIEKMPEGKFGSAQIKHFTTTQEQSTFCKLRALLNHRATEFISPGKYARLLVHGGVMMTDTDMERATNLELIRQAKGHVLVGGLGLGMVVFALLAKKPKIHSLTVLEYNPDVMELVCRHLPKDPRLSVIDADGFTWKRRRLDPKFNTIYMDIWPNVGGNYGSKVAQLREHYQPMLSPKGWMGDWQTEYHRYNKEQT